LFWRRLGKGGGVTLFRLDDENGELMTASDSNVSLASDAERAAALESIASQILQALPNAILAIAADGSVIDANAACEGFFKMSRTLLLRRKLKDLFPFGSPLIASVDYALRRGASVNEYRVDLSAPWIDGDCVVDLHVSPMPGNAQIAVIVLQERTIADKMDRQLTHRGAARSVSGLASMLAHEIKNPLSGIRGAAQLLESVVHGEDRALTRLICEETDRIVNLVGRMEVFSDARPIQRESVNIHSVLDHVKRVAQAGFARHIRFLERYDPSLPPVHANRDQLVQVFLNLVKNAAEAMGQATFDGEIELSTAYRPGVRFKAPGSSAQVNLPLEFCVRDNGPGVPPDIAANIFEPFVTNKATGTGLGLALVAKIIGDHGGTVECESHPRKTTFRVLMPMFASTDGRLVPAE
jgi:two-component system, NtrC family, nitrogen regulation sensor histidine kinase GlnL